MVRPTSAVVPIIAKSMRSPAGRRARVDVDQSARPIVPIASARASMRRRHAAIGFEPSRAGGMMPHLRCGSTVQHNDATAGAVAMTIRNLDVLFAPKSVALIGASRHPRSVGAVLAHN